MALQYVKWPRKNSFDEFLSKDEWKILDEEMRDVIAKLIKNCSTKDAVFALGETLAEIHTQKVKTKSPKLERMLNLKHDYVLTVYDYLFERLL